MAECPICDVEVEVIYGRFVSHDDCPGSFARVNAALLTTEDRYTDPNPYCPYPERWHSSDADSTEHEVSALVAAFVRALRPDLVIETGSAYGQTAQAIGEVLALAGVGKLHTIEPNVTRAEITRQRCAGLPVIVEQMGSLEFVPPGPVGFAWLDSLLPLRVPEFERFYPYLVHGAIVGFHDTAPHHGAQLWDLILQQEGYGRLLPIRLRTPRGVVFAEVVRE